MKQGSRWYLVLLLIVLVPLLWFRGKHISFGDVAFPVKHLNYSDFEKYFFAWDNYFCFGKGNIVVAWLFPYVAFWYLLGSVLAIPLLYIPFLWFSFILTVLVVSVWDLCGTLGLKPSWRPPASIFYGFSLYFLAHVTTLQWLALLVYAIAPFLLSQYMKALKGDSLKHR